MSYQERALAIIYRLTDSKAITIRERRTLRRAILLPERPQGEWLEPYESKIAQECSICHRQMPAPEWFHFCPNCGADMRGTV